MSKVSTFRCLSNPRWRTHVLYIFFFVLWHKELMRDFACSRRRDVTGAVPPPQALVHAHRLGGRPHVLLRYRGLHRRGCKREHLGRGCSCAYLEVWVLSPGDRGLPPPLPRRKSPRQTLWWAGEVERAGMVEFCRATCSSPRLWPVEANRPLDPVGSIEFEHASTFPCSDMYPTAGCVS